MGGDRGEEPPTVIAPAEDGAARRWPARRRPARRWRLASRLALPAAIVTGLLTALLGAPPVLAANSVIVTTPYPAVSVAPGSKASFDLTVTATLRTRVDLSISGVPTGWTAQLNGGGYVVTAVLANSTTPATLRLDVKVPADAAAGSTHLVVSAAAGSLHDELPIDIDVSSAVGGDVTIATDFPSLQGPASTSFSFNLTLSNNTAQDLTFGLNAQGPTGWTVTAKPTSQNQASTFQVNAGDTAGVTVSADPPPNVATGAYAIDVSATAGDRTVGGKLQVEITGQFSMTLTTPDGRLNANGAAGGVVARTLSIENTGTAPLTAVTLSETLPSDWKVTYDPPGPIASIAPGQSVTVTANMVPAGNAIAGDYVATFRANSPDASTSASTDIRVTVETPLNWLIVGGGLIVLILLALGWIFQRYGRR